MRRMASALRIILVAALVVVMAFSMVGCAKKESIVGKWQSVENSKVIEFKADGTYSGVQAKSYKYEAKEDGTLKIINPEDKSGKDALVIKYSIKDGVLTTESDGYKASFKRLTGK